MWIEQVFTAEQHEWQETTVEMDRNALLKSLEEPYGSSYIITDLVDWIWQDINKLTWKLDKNFQMTNESESWKTFTDKLWISSNVKNAKDKSQTNEGAINVSVKDYDKQVVGLVDWLNKILSENQWNTDKLEANLRSKLWFWKLGANTPINISSFTNNLKDNWAREGFSSFLTSNLEKDNVNPEKSTESSKKWTRMNNSITSQFDDLFKENNDISSEEWNNPFAVTWAIKNIRDKKLRDSNAIDRQS